MHHNSLIKQFKRPMHHILGLQGLLFWSLHTKSSSKDMMKVLMVGQKEYERHQFRADERMRR